jgi:hypothetical protein
LVRDAVLEVQDLLTNLWPDHNHNHNNASYN